MFQKPEITTKTRTKARSKSRLEQYSYGSKTTINPILKWNQSYLHIQSYKREELLLKLYVKNETKFK